MRPAVPPQPKADLGELRSVLPNCLYCNANPLGLGDVLGGCTCGLLVRGLSSSPTTDQLVREKCASPRLGKPVRCLAEDDRVLHLDGLAGVGQDDLEDVGGTLGTFDLVIRISSVSHLSPPVGIVGWLRQVVWPLPARAPHHRRLARRRSWYPPAALR